MNKETLIEELKVKIIENLNLPGISPQDIDSTTELFSENGLGLDSVDVLELVVMLEKDYKISIEDNSAAKDIFVSVDAMADYILKNQK